MPVRKAQVARAALKSDKTLAELDLATPFLSPVRRFERAGGRGAQTRGGRTARNQLSSA